jgi:hypothetical protein
VNAENVEPLGKHVQIPPLSRCTLTGYISVFKPLSSRSEALKAPKQLELPPDVARAFVDDMRAYFAEENPIKRDGIAVRQLRALREHQGPREKKLRLST